MSPRHLALVCASAVALSALVGCIPQQTVVFTNDSPSPLGLPSERAGGATVSTFVPATVANRLRAKFPVGR